LKLLITASQEVSSYSNDKVCAERFMYISFVSNTIKLWW